MQVSETISRLLWWVLTIVASVAFFYFTRGMQIHEFALALMASVISLAVLLGLFEGVWYAAMRAFGAEG
jgi:preprotein translocase subunit SecF